jgi:hypothetical protein
MESKAEAIVPRRTDDEALGLEDQNSLLPRAELVLALPKKVVHATRALLQALSIGARRNRINLSPMSDNWLIESELTSRKQGDNF